MGKTINSNKSSTLTQHRSNHPVAPFPILSELQNQPDRGRSGGRTPPNTDLHILPERSEEIRRILCVTLTERVRKMDAVGRKIQLFRTVGASKSYIELEMDQFKDISGDLMG